MLISRRMLSECWHSISHMISQYHIELLKNKFHGPNADNLLIIYIYKNYVFGIVKEIIPLLRLPQITASELESCVKLEHGREYLDGLLAARCIFTPDSTRELIISTLIDSDIEENSILLEVKIREMVSSIVDEKIESLKLSNVIEEKKKIEEVMIPIKRETVTKQLDILDMVSMRLGKDEK